MRKIVFILMSLLFAFVGNAYAGDDSRFYISGSVGKLFGSYNSEYNESTSIQPGASDNWLEQGYGTSVSGDIDYQFAIISAIGMRFKNPDYRAEFEYSYRNGTAEEDATNSIYGYQVDEGEEILDEEGAGTGEFESVTTGASLDYKFPGYGNQEIHSLMVNFYKDFHGKSRFTPYFGAGLGISFQKTDYTVNAVRVTGGTLEAPETESFEHQENETKTALGIQGMLGISAALTNSISANLGYRIFGTSEDVFTQDLEAGITLFF